MLDPSNPMPSSNASALNSLADTVKCCHKPGRSTNRRSTACTLCSLMNDMTPAGFIGSPSNWGAGVDSRSELDLGARSVFLADPRRVLLVPSSAAIGFWFVFWPSRSAASGTDAASAVDRDAHTLGIGGEPAYSSVHLPSTASE